MGFVANDRQRQAIEHVHGPMLVVAGAGTGKTTVLSQRIARLIADGHARPDEILAVTYTDAAALHLKRKVDEALRDIGAKAETSRLRAQTFHAYCFGLLQENGRGFKVVTNEDFWIFLRRHIEKLGLKHFLPPRDPGEFLDALCDFFSRCQDELVDVRRYEQYVEEVAAGKCPLPRVAPTRKNDLLSGADIVARCREIAHVFGKVEQLLSAANLGTFGHMICRGVELLRSDAGVLVNARHKARFLLIDEFQDANVAQIELARILGGDERNVFAVGDPDQAIFRFRGASSAAFAEFVRRFPGTKGVVLNENQRSTSHILSCAYALISRNPEVDCEVASGLNFRRERLVSARELRAAAAPAPARKTSDGPQLTLFGSADEPGKLVPYPPAIVLSDTKDQEAADVADDIEALYAKEAEPDIAVIYRLHMHADEVARELARREIPHVVRGIDALETADGRDFVSALASVASYANTEDLFRLSALPMFGLDPEDVRDALRTAKGEGSYATLLARIPRGEQVVKSIEGVRAYAASVDWDAEKLVPRVLRDFGFDREAPDIRRIASFVSEWRGKGITETGTLAEFVEYLGQLQAAGGNLSLPEIEAPGAVQLMTVHSAKGREFRHVFVLRANTGSFPCSYRESIFEFPQALREMPAADDSKTLNAEEERRLFYVAITRARDFLTIHAKPGWGKDRTPPGLLREMMCDRSVKGAWTERPAREPTVAIAAGALQVSAVASWMLLPPAQPIEPVLSATAIDAYDACPLKFKLMREWNIPGPASAAMIYGNVMHTVLKDLHDAERAGRPREQGQVLGLFGELMDAAEFEDDLQQRLYREQGLRQLGEYIRLRNARPNPTVLEAEKNFLVKIAGIRVKGRMDRVDQLEAGTRVIDFKTGKAFTEQKAQNSVQLGIYALAGRELWGALPKELVIYNLEDNSEVCSRRTERALADLERKVMDVAAGITAGEFHEQPGFHCRWCDFRNVCPAHEQQLHTVVRTAAAN